MEREVLPAGRVSRQGFRGIITAAPVRRARAGKELALRLRRAFTLVELLVVIAIIALLAAILFPVFAQAREKGRAVTCASNLRNLATAMLMYAQDYDERLPPAVIPTSTRPFFAAWHDLIDPYVKNKQVWLCPSSDIPPTDADGTPTSHFGYNAFYLANLRLDFSNVGTTAAGVHLGAVAEPAGTVLLADARASKEKNRCGPDGKYLLPPSQAAIDCWGWPAARHNDGCNVAWLDGHVKWMRLAQFYEGQSPVDRAFDLQ
jgi:prepilin-type N-terminal cleavage/methylation domain-containing protein/prepilin-type processing-associated H-X9-DG protein